MNTKVNTKVYIDADIIAFKASAAAEKRSVKVYDDNGKYIGLYKTRTEFKKSIDGNIDHYTFEDVQEAEPVENALHTVKKMIESICEKAEADEYFTVLSGKNNFRDGIPLPTKYKGQRKDLLRPLLLNDVKEYISKHHDCIITDGWEADDELSMRAYEGFKTGQKIIQATTDKDALQCEGWLLNWDKQDTPTLIKGWGKLTHNPKDGVKGTGMMWLLAQSVLGDSTDGYKPCQLSGAKFGDVGCYNLLKDCKNPKQGFKAVYEQYKKWYPEPVTYTAWDGKEYTKDAVEIWQMYFDCARMLRKPDDKVFVRDVLTKLEIEI